MIEAITERVKELRDENGQLVFMEVKSALDVVSAMAKPINASPVVFIVPLEETPLTSQVEMGQQMQMMRSGFGTLIGLRSVGMNENDNAKLQKIRKQLRDCLFGWIPGQGYKPLLLGQSNIQQLQVNQLFWMDRFITERLEESVL